MLLKALGLIALVIASMAAWTFSGQLISAPSDIQVLLGIAIAVAVVFTWFAVLNHFRKSILKWIETKEQSTHCFFILAVIIGVGLASSACTTVEPGHVGIMVNSYGSNKGVSDYPAVTGFVWYNPFSTSVIEYPVYMQNVSWTKSLDEGHAVNEEISFNNADQMTIFADISASYQLDQNKAPAFYVKFRADEIDKWTHGYLRNVTRQKFDEIAGKYKIEVIMGDNAKFLDEVKAAVQSDVKEYGITLGAFGFIGSPPANGSASTTELSRSDQ
jgi:hypothetical protein